MTDNEIVKALEHCPQCVYGSCPECPMYEVEGCDNELMKCALDLINRQKEEIERLRQANADICEAGGKLLRERKTIRGATIKEFAERLKSKIENLEYKVKLERRIVSLETLRDQVNWVLHEITPNIIDNLAKEMTEETKHE